MRNPRVSCKNPDVAGIEAAVKQARACCCCCCCSLERKTQGQGTTKSSTSLLVVVNREREDRDLCSSPFRSVCRQVCFEQRSGGEKNKAKAFKRWLLALKCGKWWSPSLANFKHSESCPALARAKLPLTSPQCFGSISDTCKPIHIQVRRLRNNTNDDGKSRYTML